MKAKLIKTEVNYLLENQEGVIIASTSVKKEGLALSLKNCEAIERGYDLDEDELEELAEDMLSSKDWDNDITLPFNGGYIKGVIEGFQKALEIIGNKKFSEEDIIIAMTCMQGQEVFYEKTFEETQKSRESYIKNYIQSLQQTEWDVEIKMELDLSAKNAIERSKYIPKLDPDGCLILKRI